MYGFIYIWFDKVARMYYIGSHKGSVDDGYICSSRWMKPIYKNRPETFKRRILEKGYYDTIVDLRNAEDRWLDMIKPHEFGVRYYNKLNWASGNKAIAHSPEHSANIRAALRGKKKSESHCFNLSKAKKGKTPSTKGPEKHTEETKQKMAEGNKAAWARRKADPNYKACEISEETRRKWSEGHKRQRQREKELGTRNYIMVSQETRDKMSAAQKKRWKNAPEQALDTARHNMAHARSIKLEQRKNGRS